MTRVILPLSLSLSSLLFSSFPFANAATPRGDSPSVIGVSREGIAGETSDALRRAYLTRVRRDFLGNFHENSDSKKKFRSVPERYRRPSRSPTGTWTGGEIAPNGTNWSTRARKRTRGTPRDATVAR